MENKLIKVKLSEGGLEGICSGLDEKLLNDAGFRRGELMAVKIRNGRIEIERGEYIQDTDVITESMRIKSFYDNGYKGYEVKVRLERHKEFEPLFLSNAHDVYDFLKPLQYEPREKVLTVMLDNSNKVVGVHESAKGCIDRALLTPLEVFQPAYLLCVKKNPNKILKRG